MLFSHLAHLNTLDLVLASGSPRRRTLLQTVGLEAVRVVPSTFPEDLDHALFAHPSDYVVENARRKAEEVFAAEKAHKLAEGRSGPNLVIGADTVVVLDGKILEKPRDKQHAEEMLLSLSGRSHLVFTGVVLIYFDQLDLTVKSRMFFEQTEVRFAPIEGVVKDYVASGEPMDKAGGYGYQGLASSLVEGINGCYFNVVGFPVHRFCKEVAQLVSTGSL